MESLGGGNIVLKSASKISGPLLPTILVGRLGGPTDDAIPRVSLQGTVKSQNLQLALAPSEKGRPNGSPQPVRDTVFLSRTHLLLFPSHPTV